MKYIYFAFPLLKAISTFFCSLSGLSWCVNFLIRYWCILLNIILFKTFTTKQNQ